MTDIDKLEYTRLVVDAVFAFIVTFVLVLGITSAMDKVESTYEISVRNEK